MLERRPVEPGEDERLVPRRLRAGVDVDRGRTSAGPGGSSREVQAWTSNAAWLPSQHSVATPSAIRCSFASRSSTPTSFQRRSQAGAVGGCPSARSPGRSGAVREALEVERPLGEVRQHRRRDPGEVADQLALRDRRVAAAVERREEDLVEVRELQVSPRRPDVPHALGRHRRERARARRRVASRRSRRPRSRAAAAGAAFASRSPSSMRSSSILAGFGHRARVRLRGLARRCLPTTPPPRGTTARGSRPSSMPLNEVWRTMPVAGPAAELGADDELRLDPGHPLGRRPSDLAVRGGGGSNGGASVASGASAAQPLPGRWR